MAREWVPFQNKSIVRMKRFSWWHSEIISMKAVRGKALIVIDLTCPSTGVQSTDDPLWDDVFHRNFKGDLANGIHFDTHFKNIDVDCDWYPVLGNHDWEGEPQAQIKYRHDKRWKMNNFYYSKLFKSSINESSAEFFFIDTAILCPEIR